LYVFDFFAALKYKAFLFVAEWFLVGQTFPCHLGNGWW
jgi:hypothetical protein